MHIMSEEVLRAAVEAMARGEAAALVTIIHKDGSAPQRAGTKMLVWADGRTVGTIGGGCCEHDACLRAREAIRLRRSQLVQYDLDDDAADQHGLICGGRMQVFVEPLEGTPHLYVVGAGHIGYHVARAAHEVGFQVHVLDDREKYANSARFPCAAEVAVADIPDWLARIELPSESYAVIVTRGHQHDLEALRVLVRRNLRYLGVIGSQTKVKRVFEALERESVPAEALDRVFGPIGLDIGAVTPAEIAVSIVAELIAVRSGRMAEPHFAAQPLRLKRRHEPAAPRSGV